MKRPRSIAFPLITLGLDALGVGIIAPIVPGLVQQLAHHLAAFPRRSRDPVGAVFGVRHRRSGQSGRDAGRAYLRRGTGGGHRTLLAAALFFAFTSPVLSIRLAGAPFVLAAIAATLAGTLLRRHLKQS